MAERVDPVRRELVVRRLRAVAVPAPGKRLDVTMGDGAATLVDDLVDPLGDDRVLPGEDGAPPEGFKPQVSQ